MENLKLRKAAILMVRNYRRLARMDDCETCNGKGCSFCQNKGKSDWRICPVDANIIQEMIQALVPEKFDNIFYRERKRNPKNGPPKLFHRACLKEVFERREGHFCTGNSEGCGRNIKDLLSLLEHQLFHDGS